MEGEKRGPLAEGERVLLFGGTFDPPHPTTAISIFSKAPSRRQSPRGWW